MRIETSKQNIKKEKCKKGSILKLFEGRGWVGTHRLIIKNNECNYQCLSLDVEGCSLVPRIHESLDDIYNYYENDIEFIYNEDEYALKILI